MITRLCVCMCVLPLKFTFAIVFWTRGGFSVVFRVRCGASYSKHASYRKTHLEITTTDCPEYYFFLKFNNKKPAIFDHEEVIYTFESPTKSLHSSPVIFCKT